MRILQASELKTGIKWDGSNPSHLVQIFKQMENICTENKGIGLAGVQVGVDLNIFIIKEKDRYNWYVNTTYTPHFKSKRVKSVEGCLSIKNDADELVFYELNRYDIVNVVGTKMNEMGELESVNMILNQETQSFAFQHEIDHLTGILISQLGKKVN